MLTITSMPETIDKAIAIENNHIKSYREWALRFRTFSPELSVTLQAQADEMEEHRSSLAKYAGIFTYEAIAPAGSTALDDAISARHFFIVDAGTANNLLTKAIELKKEARDFYKKCMINELGDSSLNNLYDSLYAFKKIHVQILLEAQDRFLARCCGSEQATALA